MMNKSKPSVFTIPFLKKSCVVSEKGCWEWQKSKDKRGYGLFKHRFSGGVWMYTHRAMFEAHNGTIPEGMILMHSCDNPCCCNPEHLTVGTQKENIQDMLEKGRQNSKLTRDQVYTLKTEIKFMGNQGATKDIWELWYHAKAEELGVSPGTIALIHKGKTWQHVKL